MDPEVYRKKFACAVRWRLRRSEADEVLADYEEIFAQREKEGDDALLEEFGPPLQAARVLTDKKEYRRWLAAFGVMVLSLLLCEFMLLRVSTAQYPAAVPLVLYAVGLLTALNWFRPHRKERKKLPLPKGLLPVLVGLGAISVVCAVVLAGLFTQAWASLPLEWYGPIVQWTMEIAGVIASLAGLVGVVKARMSDHRWSAVYVMALLMVTECLLVLAVLGSVFSFSPAWWVPWAVQAAVVGLVGLVGVGVSLC